MGCAAKRSCKGGSSIINIRERLIDIEESNDIEENVVFCYARWIWMFLGSASSYFLFTHLFPSVFLGSFELKSL